MSAKSNKIELIEELWLRERRTATVDVLQKRSSYFTKFTGKHLCQSLFFNKVAGPAQFLRITLLTEYLRVTASKV